jgi:hypothetical protein
MILFKKYLSYDIVKLRKICRYRTYDEFIYYTEKKNIIPDIYCLENACISKNVKLIEYLDKTYKCNYTINCLSSITNYEYKQNILDKLLILQNLDFHVLSTPLEKK